ncbi:MAG: phosphoribosylformylglycinamidine cyclo-ligase [Gemmatimonadota bacterium]
MVRAGPYSYREAGVDLEAADALKARLARLVDSTRTRGVEVACGSFGGRFRISGEAELVASADGVGTKLLVAIRAGRHDTVGEDLVNHCVNDILCEGAVPLFFLDYLAFGMLEPDTAEAVVEGVARGCRCNGLALLGGETAEMPGVYRPGEYDLAGFIVGRTTYPIVARRQLAAGDRLIGLASSGLHTNGYSFARGLLFERLGMSLAEEWPGTGESVADVLLRMHRSYLEPLREACAAGWVRGLAHVTGGGIPGNLGRLLPASLDAVVDPAAWEPGPVFRFLALKSGATAEELYRTLNMGVGMIAVVRPEHEAPVIESVRRSGCEAFRCGELVDGGGAVRLRGVT